MPSQLHEVLVAMVRDSDDLARLIAGWALGEPIADGVQLRTRDQAYSEVKPPEYRADLVVELASDGSSKPTSMMILEVQLTRDTHKRRTWPAYQAVLRAQYGCPTLVVVLAPDAGVARWCAEPIDLDGRGTSVMRPTVIGPEQVPLVIDPAHADRLPALSVLSAIAHGHSERAIDVARAGLHAAGTLDETDSTLYADVILHHLDAAARAALERERMALKLKNKYEYQSATVRKILAEGRREGRVEGRVEGKLGTLRVLLEARGFHVEESLKQRLQACDPAELDALVVRAASIESLDELFED